MQFENLTLGYNGHPAVHHLTGEVADGALLAVVGENGSGKSTLLKGIAGLLKPLSGSISGHGESRLAYLAQRSELDLTFPVNVSDLVSLGLWQRRGLLGRHSREDRDRVTKALSAVGLSGFERRALDTLSGGQLQRALFARVMVQDAKLILLDEPFNAIDMRTVTDLVALIKAWHAEGRTVIVVVHDLELVRAHLPETLLLARRAVAWGATGDVLTAERLADARRFDEAWREDAPWCETEPHEHDDRGQAHQHHDHHSHRAA